MGRINKKRVDLRALNQWSKALERKVSIRVGIIGKEAAAIHGGSNLTNAELGAVYEFGGTLPVTDKMRKYLYSQGLRLQKETTTINLPAHSFLREPILGKEGRKEILKVVRDELGRSIRAADLSTNTANKILDDAVHMIAETALYRVQEAFANDGIKPPAKPSSKKSRKYNPENPTLVDTGQLQRSITYEVKEIK